MINLKVLVNGSPISSELTEFERKAQDDEYSIGFGIIRNEGRLILPKGSLPEDIDVDGLKVGMMLDDKEVSSMLIKGNDDVTEVYGDFDLRNNYAAAEFEYEGINYADPDSDMWIYFGLFALAQSYPENFVTELKKYYIDNAYLPPSTYAEAAGLYGEILQCSLTYKEEVFMDR